jgi:hypothetical protein
LYIDEKTTIRPPERKACRVSKKKKDQKHNAARDPVRDLGREFVSKKIKTAIKNRFGLPEDCMVFRVPQFGETKERMVTCGTVVLVNLAGNKLICVARFNKEVRLNWASLVLTLC